MADVLPSTREIQVRLFGAFRDLAPSGLCSLKIHGGESVGALKQLLAKELSAVATPKFDIQALMAKSALATESRVLTDDEKFEGATIAILPPVCGG